jgi:hypothetical protein
MCQVFGVYYNPHLNPLPAQGEEAAEWEAERYHVEHVKFNFCNITTLCGPVQRFKDWRGAQSQDGTLHHIPFHPVKINACDVPTKLQYLTPTAGRRSRTEVHPSPVG